MTRARMIFSMLFVALSLTAAPAFAAPVGVQILVRPAGYPAAIRYEEALEAKVLERVNAVRVRYGLPEVRFDLRATHTARQAAAEASREGSFGYLSSSVEARLHDQGISLSYEMGELTKIAREGNLDATARTIVQAWLLSPRLARVLLDPELTYGGVGAVAYGNKVALAFDAFGPRVVVKPSTHC